MRVGEPSKMCSSINVTPLVDVVLVLLIIFMVMAPQLQHGPDVALPRTEQPRDQSGEAARIVLTIEHGGGLWIESDPVTSALLGDGLRKAAGDEDDPKVVIKGDARLTFGEVKRAMLAVEQAGFHDVSLIAERGTASPHGG